MQIYGYALTHANICEEPCLVPVAFDRRDSGRIIRPGTTKGWAGLRILEECLACWSDYSEKTRMVSLYFISVKVDTKISQREWLGEAEMVIAFTN